MRGGLVRSFEGMNSAYTVQSLIEIAPAVQYLTCFPAGPTMQLFKCHPVELCERQIRTGCPMFQAQKKVIKQSLGQWILSNWKVHTWQQECSFMDDTGRSLPGWKSSGAACSIYVDIYSQIHMQVALIVTSGVITTLDRSTEEETHDQGYELLYALTDPCCYKLDRTGTTLWLWSRVREKLNSCSLISRSEDY